MNIRHKYRAVRTERGGFKFDSKKEASRYGELLQLKKAGEVVFFMLQPPFYFPEFETKFKYVADFMVFWADGSVTVEDVKGLKTQVYGIKKKLMAKYYPEIEIQEI